MNKEGEGVAGLRSEPKVTPRSTSNPAVCLKSLLREMGMEGAPNSQSHCQGEPVHVKSPAVSKAELPVGVSGISTSFAPW